MNDQPNTIKAEGNFTLRSILTNTEVDAYIGQMQRMIDQQRKRILDAELNYHARHAELLAQINDLDASFHRQRQEMSMQLDRLLAMRDGAQPQMPF